MNLQFNLANLYNISVQPQMFKKWNIKDMDIQWWVKIFFQHKNLIYLNFSFMLKINMSSISKLFYNHKLSCLEIEKFVFSNFKSE
jgi:hypothetical protein